MNPRLLPLSALLLLAACGGDAPAKPQGPPLPPLALKPFLPVLKQLIEAMPVPGEDAQKELRELADVALRITAADARIEARAERALLEHPDAWWVLEPALLHDDAGVRRRAAWLCGRSAATVLQLPLVLRLKYESDPEAVVWVADALQRLGNDVGLGWLDAAMTAEATAQTAGQLAIEICNERGIALTEQPTWDELRGRMRELYDRWLATGEGGKPGVTPPSGPQLDARVAAHLATTEKTYLRPIDDAKFVLTRTGKLALPVLEQALGASEAYLRSTACEILARLGPCARSVGPTVTGLLADPLTASYAVRTLGEIGDQAALPHLRPLLESADTELRSAATQALGLLGDEPSRARLTARMQDPQEAMDVRVGAAFGLCCLGDAPEAEAFLDERARLGDYHEPTLTRLRERLAAMRR